MHQRSSLDPGEDSGVDLLGDIFVVGHDHTASGTSECFVGSGGDDVTVREGAGVFTRCDQSGDMCDIRKKYCTDGVGDFTEFGEIDLTWIGTRTADDQLGLDDFGDIHDTIVVDTPVHLHAVEKAGVSFS
ncbi:hypothetical protein D1872_280780 [compost metagenome]